LSKLENLLENDPYVKNADVYHFQQGVLGVRIQEKKAIIRIQGPKQYYMDSSGDFFPISKNYTPKVPLYWGTLEEEQKPDLLFLVDQLNADPFLRNELASIQYRSNSFFIGLRSFGFEVEIGQVRRLKEKISKLKVFCAYRESHPSTTEFSRINLKFKNQVVGS
jgi:cell division protein FtsQ